MLNELYTINDSNLSTIDPSHKKLLVDELESGKIVYFPKYAFNLKPNELALLSESILAPKEKNISYDYAKNRLTGVADDKAELKPLTNQFMHRFAEYAKELIDEMIPQYNESIIWGRTSYRPAEVRGRKTSKRKDDTKLHVDSFSASPVNGLRILRIFANINPNGEPRVWHVGEPFINLITKFAKDIPPYSQIHAKFLKLIKKTKTLRSGYDHYMINLHDNMKLDLDYQEKVAKKRIDFPPESTWIVFTDHVSHAALSGQYLLEQTFYLPVKAMQNPGLSPLKQWEEKLGLTLTM